GPARPDQVGGVQFGALAAVGGAWGARRQQLPKPSVVIARFMRATQGAPAKQLVLPCGDAALLGGPNKSGHDGRESGGWDATPPAGPRGSAVPGRGRVSPARRPTSRGGRG